MKTQIFAIVSALIIISAVGINSVILNNSIGEIIEAAEAIPESTECKEEYVALRDDFMKRQKFISLSVSHEDLTEIENTLAEIIGAATAEDKESLIIAKSRLMMTLSHLKRLCGINIDSIL